jgi:hypothetical protein
MGSACQGTRMGLLRHDARRSTKAHHIGRFSGWQALSDVPALRPGWRRPSGALFGARSGVLDRRVEDGRRRPQHRQLNVAR